MNIRSGSGLGLRWGSAPFAAACAAAIAAAAFSAAPARAETAYPNKPVRVVVNFTPGGPLDILARAMADALHKELKQPFIVDNRPGAAGNLGADQVAKAAGDGYTVLVSIDSTFTVNPALYAAMPFAAKDLKPLMVLASSGLTFAVNPAVKAGTLPDLVKLGKAEALTFATAGSGSPGHIAAEIFSEHTGAKISPIPYKGNAPAVMALLSGEVQAGILATPGMLQHLQGGKLRALATTGASRSPLLPQVPTVAELGLKELQFEVLYLAMVSAATPEPVLQTLRSSLQAALAAPALQARLASLDIVPLAESGPAAEQRLQANAARYSRIVKLTGMKVD